MSFQNTPQQQQHNYFGGYDAGSHQHLPAMDHNQPALLLSIDPRRLTSNARWDQLPAGVSQLHEPAIHHGHAHYHDMARSLPNYFSEAQEHGPEPSLTTCQTMDSELPSIGPTPPVPRDALGKSSLPNDPTGGALFSIDDLDENHATQAQVSRQHCMTGDTLNKPQQPHSTSSPSTSTERIVDLFFAFRQCLTSVREARNTADFDVLDDILAKCHHHIQRFYQCTMSETPIIASPNGISTEALMVPTVAMFLMILSMALDVYATLIDLDQKVLCPVPESHDHSNQLTSLINSWPNNSHAQMATLLSNTDGQYSPEFSEPTSKRRKSYHRSQTLPNEIDKMSSYLGQLDDGRAAEFSGGGGLPVPRGPTSFRGVPNYSFRLKAVKSLATIDFHLTQFQSITGNWTRMLGERQPGPGGPPNAAGNQQHSDVNESGSMPLSAKLDTVKSEMSEMREKISRLMDTAKTA